MGARQLGHRHDDLRAKVGGRQVHAQDLPVPRIEEVQHDVDASLVDAELEEVVPLDDYPQLVDLLGQDLPIHRLAGVEVDGRQGRSQGLGGLPGVLRTIALRDRRAVRCRPAAPDPDREGQQRRRRHQRFGQRTAGARHGCPPAPRHPPATHHLLSPLSPLSPLAATTSRCRCLSSSAPARRASSWHRGLRYS